MENAQYFRTKMQEAGFDIPEGDAAIVPVMLYDAKSFLSKWLINYWMKVFM